VILPTPYQCMLATLAARTPQETRVDCYKSAALILYITPSPWQLFTPAVIRHNQLNDTIQVESPVSVYTYTFFASEYHQKNSSLTDLAFMVIKLDNFLTGKCFHTTTNRLFLNKISCERVWFLHQSNIHTSLYLLCLGSWQALAGRVTPTAAHHIVLVRRWFIYSTFLQCYQAD